MAGKTTIALAVGFALVAASIQLPAASCVLSKVSSEKTCQQGCCANKTCCATSRQRTDLPVQPLAKPASDQQNIALIAATVGVALPLQNATDAHLRLGVESRPHSLAPLALLCIRLI